MKDIAADRPFVTGHSLLSGVRNTLLAAPLAYAGTAALLVCAYFLRPALLSPLLLLLIVRQAAPLAIAAIGQSLCVRVLSLDLSIGGVILVVSYILTSGTINLPEPYLLLVCLAFGAAVGAINAYFITRVYASSVIVTLATALILTGIVYALSQLHSPSEAGEWVRYVGQKRVGIVPLAPFVWLVLFGPIAYFMRVSVLGRYVDAIGSSPRAASMSGIPHLRIVAAAHILSGLTAVFSAFVLIGFVGAGSLDIGRDLPLNSLVAVILGGVAFGSGRGGVFGPALAAFMLTFSFNLLTSLGVGEPGKLMLQGAIIAIAAARKST